MKTTPELKLFIDIIQERKPPQFGEINFSQLIELARFHDILPLIFYRLKKYDTDILQDVYTYLKNIYLSNIGRNVKLWQEFLKISAALKQSGICILPLKGMDVLVRFYPFFDLRRMVDIDVLVKEEQFEEAEKILYQLGYEKNLLGLKEKYWKEKQCHIAFYKDKISVEVHWALDFKRNNRIILTQLWQRIKRVHITDQDIEIFSPEDALFSLALHLRRFGNILSLKQVIDAGRIIASSPELNWDYILEEGKKYKMQATLYFLLLQVYLFTDSPSLENVLKKINMSNWQKKKIKKLLLKYTFQATVDLKSIYLKAHFLLYDNPFEPLLYLINIPYEQFCKFYGLKPYTCQANLFYALRLLYMSLKGARHLSERTTQHYAIRPPDENHKSLPILTD